MTTGVSIKGDDLYRGVAGLLPESEPANTFPATGFGDLFSTDLPAENKATIPPWVLAQQSDPLLDTGLKPVIRDKLIVAPAQFRALLHEALVALESLSTDNNSSCEDVVTILRTELSLMDYIAQEKSRHQER
ncbi:MAG: hypothetical protein ACWA44_10180 [Thiotrichales bacterium]